MMPIGTRLAMCSRRANAKPIADSSRAIAGVHTSQSPLRKCRLNQPLHSCSRGNPTFSLGPFCAGTVSTRMPSKRADTISSQPLSTFDSGNSMLLWPPSTQTSPTKTSSS